MGDSIYVIKPDTFFSNIALDSIARNNINKELETNTQQELKKPSELYNAIENWDTGDSLAKAEWKQWALSDFEGFKEYYKQYKTLIKNLDIDKLYGAKAKPNRVASYGTKNDIGKELFQSLLKSGFSEVLALAILANSYHETMGWNKMNLLNNGPASGLLQMEEAARLLYTKFREANNLEENTDALALYMASLFLNGKSIPTTYYDNSGKGEAYTTALALEDWNSGDLDKTVKAFMYSYERPGTPMLDKRLGVALLLNDNKHLFYKEGGSIKRNDIKSALFAKDGLPGGMQFMYLLPSSTSVQHLSSVLPVEYHDKNIVQSAKALGLTVEEYLKLIEKSNLPGVVYEDSGNDGVNYYRSRTAADPRVREAAAVERQRQDQALEQQRLLAGKATNLLFSLGMPSTYVGLTTGAMDLATGEGKNTTGGKIWENTRLVLDLALPFVVSSSIGSNELAYRTQKAINSIKSTIPNHIGPYYYRPIYNNTSYIRQIGNDAVADLKRTRLLRSSSVNRTLLNNTGRILLQKNFLDLMFYTGRPFYGTDKHYNYIIKEPEPIIDNLSLKNKGIEWIESSHKNHSAHARLTAIEQGLDPDKAVGRIVVPLYNGSKEIIPVSEFGPFDLYEYKSIFGIPFYKRTKFNYPSNIGKNRLSVENILYGKNSLGLSSKNQYDLNEAVANAFYLAGLPVNATTNMFGEVIPDVKSEWVKFIRQLVDRNKNFGQGVWHIDHFNNIPKNNILTDGRGYLYTWWDERPDIRSGHIGSHTPEAHNVVYYFPVGSKGSNIVLDSPIAPSGHMTYKKVGPIDISEAFKYKWNGNSWIQF